MEPVSKQDGSVNKTRSMEALSPWLNHPRKTIVQVEGLVLVAAALLLLQLIFGSCRRRWHNSFLKYGLQVCNGIMSPLILYTLGTMQSSPIKNLLYPVWAGFLIMASAGTTAVRQHDFYGSFYYKYIQGFGEFIRDIFYGTMFILLMVPSDYNLKTIMNDPKEIFKTKARSSIWVTLLVLVALGTKNLESLFLVTIFGDRKKKRHRTQDAEARTEESANDRASDSDPHNMKSCKYEVRFGLQRLITIDQIWDYRVINSAYGKELKDLCLSYALSQRLLSFFGLVYPETSLTKDHDFVFKQLLPPEGDFKRAFRIIEVELGYCYDFFFTKYYYNFFLMGSPLAVNQFFFLYKILSILMVGVFAIRKSLVLETPNPIIEVQISKTDYIITLLVLSIALLVELVQAAFYLASNWAQVSLACLHVKKHLCEPSAYIYGKIIGFLSWVMVSGKLRNKIDQHSVIFPLKQQPDPVEVSDAVKKAIARSLRLTYANNLTTNEKEAVMARNYMLDEYQMWGKYSWALKDFSRLHVMLIWHIATEYCDAISDDPSDGNGATPSSNHRGAHLFGYVLQLFGYVLQLLRPNPIRNRIARDGDRGVAVHLSRYCAYLIESVPELLPYHQAYITEVTEKVTEERDELFGSCIQSEKYYKMKNLQGTEEGDNPTTIFKKGVKLGKQLEKMADGFRWFVMEDFWTKKIIHAADSHYTTKQHMQHLENGGEFLTHIWALLVHAGILDRDQSQGVRIPAPHVQVTEEANLSSAPTQEEIV